MGIFNKLFKPKEKITEIKDNDPPKYKAEWDFYFSNIDDVIGSFFVDLGLNKIAPVADKPNLIWISINMNDPKENGLSSNSEYDILCALEDRLLDFVKQRHNAIWVGRLTTNGKRTFYFYNGDFAFFDNTFSEAMVAFPNYEYDFDVVDDASWNTYFGFLYPLPSQFQSIQNRRVLENLEKNGDPLTKERQVDHWIFFKTAADRNGFLEKIKDEGFDIVNSDFNKEFGETPFRLRISRVDKVDYGSVDDYVLMLWRYAGECNGEYDGWETRVEIN